MDEPTSLVLREGITQLPGEVSLLRGQDTWVWKDEPTCLSLPPERRAWMKAGQGEAACRRREPRAGRWRAKGEHSRVMEGLGGGGGGVGKLNNLCISPKLLGNPGEA